MPEPMSLKSWLEQTDAGTFATRSSTLKAVDRALERYHATNSAADAGQLKKALAAWIDEKGARWKTTDRNRWGAVERLVQQVSTLPGGQELSKMSKWVLLTPLDLAAIEEMKQEGVRLVTTLFSDKKLISKQSYLSDVRAKYQAALQKKPPLLRSGGNPASLQNQPPLLRMGAMPQPLQPSLANAGKPQPTLPQSVVNPGLMQRAGRYVTSDDSKKKVLGADIAYGAMQLLNALVGSESHSEIMAELTTIMPDFVKEFAAAATPIVGLITAAGSVTYHASQLLQKQCWMDSMADHINAGFSSGNPVAAMRAMVMILERQRNQEARNVGYSSAELGGKLLGMLVDGGTLTNIGVAITSYIAKLMDLVLMIRRDVKERNLANIIMMSGVDLDSRLFRTCPVLGAYYVCCAPTSVLVDRLLDHCGQAGSQGEVEYTAQKHIEPLRVQARLLIKDSRFVIPELQTFPGAMVKRELTWMEWLALPGNKRAQRTAELRLGKATDKYGHVSGPSA